MFELGADGWGWWCVANWADRVEESRERRPAQVAAVDGAIASCADLIMVRTGRAPDVPSRHSTTGLGLMCQERHPGKEQRRRQHEPINTSRTPSSPHSSKPRVPGSDLDRFLFSLPLLVLPSSESVSRTASVATPVKVSVACLGRSLSGAGTGVRLYAYD